MFYNTVVLGVPAAVTDENLNCWSICKLVNFCLERGNCDASCYASVVLSRVAIGYFRDYKTAFRFGQVGLALIDRRGLKRFEGRTYSFFAGLIAPWMKHVRTCVDLWRRGYDAANKIGDFTFANYANYRLICDLLVAGDHLSELQRKAELSQALGSKAGLAAVLSWPRRWH